MPAIGTRSFVVDHLPEMPKGRRFRLTPTKYFSLFDDGVLGWYIDTDASARMPQSYFATRGQATAFGDGFLAAGANAPAKPDQT